MKKTISLLTSLMLCFCLLAAMPTADTDYSEAEAGIMQVDETEFEIPLKTFPPVKEPY